MTTLENWLNRELVPRIDECALIQLELDACTGILNDVFGAESEPVRRYNNKWRKGVRDFVASARALTEDWITRWGHAYGLKSFDSEQVMKNMIRAGILSDRVEFLNYVVENMIPNNKWESPIEITIPGSSKSQILTGIEPLNTFFPKTQGRQRVEGYKDSQVPWIYVFDGKSKQYTFLKDKGHNLLRRLYTGELGNLSEEAKAELSRLKAVVLNGQSGLMIANHIQQREDDSVISIDGNYGVFYDTNPWLAGTLEHETQHLRDFRFLDGTPDCMPLSELRAFSKERDYYQKNNSLYPAGIIQQRVESTDAYLSEYAGACKGFRNITKTHNYNPMKDFLTESIEFLDDEERRRFVAAIADHPVE